MQLIVLGAEEIRRCVDMHTAVDLMARAFSALSRGDAVVPQRTVLKTERGITLTMPAWLPGEAAPDGEEAPAAGELDLVAPEDARRAGEVREAGLVTKVVSVHPGNRARGMPVVQAAVLVMDAETGAPVALLDGDSLTALRTGAASGLATRLLARVDARVLAVFGAGAQARTQIEGVRAVRPIREVRIVSKGGVSARKLAAELEGVDARAVADPVEAVAGAGVIVTATTSAVPVVRGSAVDDGAHVNGVGSYTADMREVDAELVGRSLVVVDSRSAARVEAGDLIQAVEEGAVGWDHLHGELGELVDGRLPGRTSPSQVTFFKSVGSAVQDVVVASRVVEEARRRGMGARVEL